MKMAVKLKRKIIVVKTYLKIEKNAAFLLRADCCHTHKSFFVQQWRTSPAVFTAISAFVLNFFIEIFCARS